MKERIYKMLVNIPWTRERSRRMEGITKLLMAHRMWDETNRTGVTLDDLIDFATSSATADRAWRDILEEEENKHLRGSDYDKKEEIEQNYILNQGYEVGHSQDIKKLKTI